MKELRSFWHKPITVEEVNNLASETIPDQTMSLRTIIDRFVHGSPVPPVGRETLMYSEDEEDIRFMDISEKHALAKAAKQQYDEANLQLSDIEKEETAERERVRLEKIKLDAVEAYKNSVGS